MSNNALNESWFYELNGERVGSVPGQEIIHLVEQGVLQRDVLVWQKGLTDWVSLAQTDLVAHVSEVPPPLSQVHTPPPLPNTGPTISPQATPNKTTTSPGASVSNVAVWFLAFAPLIGAFSEGVLASILNNGSPYNTLIGLTTGYYFLFTIALNMGLYYLDERGLKKAGIAPKAFKGHWLIPTYLYARSKALGHNVAYTVIWSLSFVYYLVNWYLLSSEMGV
ncbi:MAG: DUF4339 domain-containing protein [Vibrio hibernica]